MGLWELWRWRSDGAAAPVVTEERVLGLRCLRVSVPVRPGLREDRRKRRAEQGAAALYRAGVRRALTAEDFPDWPALEGQGLRSVDPEPFCQAIAVPLALAALRRAGILRVRPLWPCPAPG